MTELAPKPDHCTCSAIRKAARHVTQHYDRHLAPVGITVNQYGILARIAGLGPIPINRLAARLFMDRTTLGRTLRPLEREGLVRIEPDPDDKRRRGLVVTEAGRALLDQARPLWAEAQSRFAEAYGPEEDAALRVTLAGLLATDLATPEPRPAR
ncbi:MAG: winged helix-turn-helix transcriptional regulator [Methylobacteriaceae bacterium]|nr:winged helix-turn-helix transcriptional regulator [Methylobacteriaceae bacterium]